MKIDGKAIADKILTSLSYEVQKLGDYGVVPAIGVILVGEDPGSLSYINQKRKAAERIGARLILEQLPGDAPVDRIEAAIARFNSNSAVHGLIIQRPIAHARHDADAVLTSVLPQKDVDGFIPDSPFQVPVAKAVLTILEHVHADLRNTSLTRDDFFPWLTTQAIAVMGRGETAGRPIAQMLTKHAQSVSVIHSQTPNPEAILKEAHIIISCVGKKRVITRNSIEPGSILISVGIHRDEDGKLAGDYNEHEIAEVAGFYTPTPGGVGPVNVACLMQNLVNACILQKGGTL